MQDALTALRTHLLTVSALTDLVSTRIYGGELLEADVDDMPRKCLVLRYAGGLEDFRTHRVHRPRIDCFSYGENYFEGGRVDLALCEALIAIGRTEASSTILHSVGYSGCYQLKHPDEGWPYVWRSATVIAGETAVA